MEIKYCNNCGKELVLKEIGDEGLLPYCNNCCKAFPSVFNTCVIVAVINDNNIALIKQSYVTTNNWVLIAGYIKKGDSAEQTVLQEVNEETGLSVTKMLYVKSYYYEKKSMLMLGFIAHVNKGEFNISSEVDDISWFPLTTAEQNLRKGSIAYQLCLEAKNRVL
ncbi:NUDIX domain-containing protein [Clostridium sp. 'deep sea']|uniref:NAD(+) diphosphatase n=1 Tax=Clostridium sp. 'deep sea' TaxID=2779445 RepID=UPI00189652D6|nr:NUDIX domain-containing protein [Clostridium sp. 'deep sea']QOR36532.1 NUDIX domain-containing protein [Clostridium sp. 'deep sea']